MANKCFTCGASYEWQAFGDATQIKCARCVQAARQEQAVRDQTKMIAQQAKDAERRERQREEEERWRQQEQAQSELEDQLITAMENLAVELARARWHGMIDTPTRMANELMQSFATIKCPACRFDIPSDARICGQCRSPVPHDPALDAQRLKKVGEVLYDMGGQVAAGFMLREAMHVDPEFRKLLDQIDTKRVKLLDQCTRRLSAVLRKYRNERLEGLKLNVAAGREPWSTADVADCMRRSCSELAEPLRPLVAMKAGAEAAKDPVAWFLNEYQFVAPVETLLGERREEAWKKAVAETLEDIHAAPATPLPTSTSDKAFEGLRTARSAAGPGARWDGKAFIKTKSHDDPFASAVRRYAGSPLSGHWRGPERPEEPSLTAEALRPAWEEIDATVATRDACQKAKGDLPSFAVWMPLLTIGGCSVASYNARGGDGWIYAGSAFVAVIAVWIAADHVGFKRVNSARAEAGYLPDEPIIYEAPWQRITAAWQAMEASHVHQIDAWREAVGTVLHKGPWRAGEPLPALAATATAPLQREVRPPIDPATARAQSGKHTRTIAVSMLVALAAVSAKPLWELFEWRQSRQWAAEYEREREREREARELEAGSALMAEPQQQDATADEPPDDQGAKAADPLASAAPAATGPTQMYELGGKNELPLRDGTLHIRLSMEIAQEDASQITAHDAAAQDAVARVVATFSAADMETTEGRTAMKDKLEAAITEASGLAHPARVYVTELVLREITPPNPTQDSTTAPSDAPAGGSTASRVVVGGDPVILGALDKPLIDAVLKKEWSQITRCYQDGLTSMPTLGGKLAVKFTIGQDGSVSSATTKSTTLNSPSVEQCVLSVFSAMHFPEPKGGGTVMLTYPLIFTPS